jgi:ammonium transporter Rh
LKSIDTCGVLNLHGWPGLMGGVAAMFVIGGINKGLQLMGIGITIAIALVAGFIAGKVLSAFGRKAEVYVDSDEFADVEVEPKIVSIFNEKIDISARSKALADAE